jgi:hypothetical protein
MHYRDVEVASAKLDTGLLKEEDNANCVRGCYRCLLSYYNQPDHELIDRTDQDLLRTLLRLARSKVERLSPAADVGTDGWHAAIARWKLPRPDSAPLSVNGHTVSLVWRAHLVAASDQIVDADDVAALEGLGFTLVQLPKMPGEDAPSELLDLLGVAS